MTLSKSYRLVRCACGFPQESTVQRWDLTACLEVLWLDNAFEHRSLGYVVQAGLLSLVALSFFPEGLSRADLATDGHSPSRTQCLGLFTVGRQADTGGWLTKRAGMVRRKELVCRAPGSCLLPQQFLRCRFNWSLCFL